jgi:hypothetical protein
LEIRVLKPEEYHLLKQAPDEFIPDPSMSVAVAALEDGKLVGKVLMIIIPHLEGPWIAEKYRSRLMMAQGFNLMIDELRRRGLKKIFAFAANPEIEGYLKRMDFTSEPMTVWSKEI